MFGLFSSVVTGSCRQRECTMYLFMNADGVKAVGGINGAPVSALKLLRLRNASQKLRLL